MEECDINAFKTVLDDERIGVARLPSKEFRQHSKQKA